MTAQDHWRRLSAALFPHTGPLWIARSILIAVGSILRTSGQAPGMDALWRAGVLVGEAVDAIDSAAFLAGLGCPKPGRRGVIELDPMAVRVRE